MFSFYEAKLGAENLLQTRRILLVFLIEKLNEALYIVKEPINGVKEELQVADIASLYHVLLIFLCLDFFLLYWLCTLRAVS